MLDSVKHGKMPKNNSKVPKNVDFIAATASQIGD